VSSESVAIVAEELGVDAEAVLSQVAGEVEYKLRLLVQDAAKFMQRSRRQRMMPRDVENALRVRGWPSIHGFGISDADKFKFLHNQGVFFLEEEDVELGKVLDDSDKVFLPRKVPLRPSFGIHWLAVDGVQPSVVENPHLHQPAAGLSEGASELSSAPGKHLLSKELQVYYDKVVFAVVDAALGNRGAAESVYASLSLDPGLQPLMPYLSKFIFDQVNKSLNNLSLLQSVMRLARCVLVNPSLNKELYLHQLMPPILTCMVHRKLCASPFLDHWALRSFAATLIPLIYSQYGETYKDIQPRVTRTLRDALLARDKPMTTQFGAIVGLAAMGPLTVQAVLLPVLKMLLLRYTKVVLETSSALKRNEAQHCIGALQAALGSYLRAAASPTLAKAILLEEHMKPARAVVSAAGEATLPWTPQESMSTHFALFI
jgi:transcription initiation factor TFIID subunit 6